MTPMIGDSKPMARVFEAIRNYAPLDAGVMITGESGTGKGLAAWVLHRSGPRAGLPFIRFHCASLFYGEDGAPGLWPYDLSALGGGTLFLDELGDLSVPAQRRLMGLLESPEIKMPRPGGVRVVSSAQNDLIGMIQGGAFRQDLRFRLNALTLSMPPLRERKEDIPLLAGFFLEKIAERTGRPPKTLSRAAAQVCMAHPWPGNVRQLRNVLEQAAAVCPGDAILPDHLPLNPAAGRAAPEITPAPAADDRDRILDALEATRWRKNRAAEMLGMSRSTFYRKMDKLGIDA